MKNPHWSMSRLLVMLLALVALLAATVGTSVAASRHDPDNGGNGQDKVGVCHATGHSWVYIEVSEAGWDNGHSKHDGDRLVSNASDCSGARDDDDDDDDDDDQSNVVATLSFTATPESPEAVGAEIALVASSSNISSPEYRWWVKKPGNSNWEQLRTWGDNDYTWDTEGLPAGTYQLGVWVRAQGASSNVDYYQLTKEMSFELTGTNVASLSFTATPETPEAVGAEIALVASSSNISSPEYRWWVRKPGNSNWEQLRTWGDNYYTWDTEGLAAGTYQLGVWVRAQNSSSNVDYYQLTKEMSFELTAMAQSTGFVGAGSNQGQGQDRNRGRNKK